MALRGWRLFGVAGTILAYISGILLLSIISLNNPNQHRLRNGRFGDVMKIKIHTINFSFAIKMIYFLFFSQTVI